MACFRETGGSCVDEQLLQRIAAAIRALAEHHGYPTRSGGRLVAFDASVATKLHADFRIAPTQACRDEVWSFLGCVLLPDVVRWRWSGDRTPEARFVGQDRGLRHTFGRCWWRAEMLLDESDVEEPYHLLWELGEDEVVGFTERPGAVTSRRVAVAIAKQIITGHLRGKSVARVQLARDVMKRFLRLGGLVSYEGLTDEELRAVAAGIVEDSMKALSESWLRRGLRAFTKT